MDKYCKKCGKKLSIYNKKATYCHACWDSKELKFEEIIIKKGGKMKNKSVDFHKTSGILKEIEDSINEFKNDTAKRDNVEMRLRGCNHAIKIHMLDFLKEKLSYQKSFEPRKLSNEI